MRRHRAADVAVFVDARINQERIANVLDAGVGMFVFSR